MLAWPAMASPVHRKYELRCPIHGFIPFNDWERGVVNSEAYQRLRRIRQLAWTEYVYPGATHSRFEHSLGVMHLATRAYDALVEAAPIRLRDEFGYDDAGFKRDRQLLRFAALLHDVGHGPLSHAAEDLMPKAGDGHRYTHEEYSASIVRNLLKHEIEEHALNDNYKLTAGEIADFLAGSAKSARAVFWRTILDGQIDADRMDYLLRDSYHAGVRYGNFDLGRVLATITLAPGAEGGSSQIGVTAGGAHAAESIVLARYFMFTQVYFHKTRVAYDLLLRQLLGNILPGGQFPPPTAERLKEYLEWDDWKVLGLVSSGQGGEAGNILKARNHHRAVFETPEAAAQADLAAATAGRAAIENAGLPVWEERASKSWYKLGRADIPIVGADGAVRPLSTVSTVVGEIKPVNQVRLYVRSADAAKARSLIPPTR